MKRLPSVMLLDADGVLHPIRRRKAVKAVALVRIRPVPQPGNPRRPLVDRSHRTMAAVMAKEARAAPYERQADIETPLADCSTADDVRGCEGRAPEGPSRTAEGAFMTPVNARQARPAPSPRVPSAKIDLRTASSAMERDLGALPAPSPLPPPEAATSRGAIDRTVQHRCRACGDWRVAACRYALCPLPKD